MKKTFLILAVLLICIGYHGFAQSQELTLVPVNSQIEAFNRGTLAWHDYSVSRPFSININIQNGNTGPGNTNEDRIIILGDDARTTSEFTFDGSERGRYVDSEAGRCFYISFRDFERAVMLKFTKNHQLDRFILDSIQIDGNPPRQITNNTRGEHVTLLISLIDNRRNSGSRELRYEEITRNNNLSNNNSNINFRNDNFGNENSRDVRAANSNSRYIIGNGSLSIDGVYQYIIRNGSPVLSNSAIRELLMLYFNEAAYENVNHDIAIAQMLYWTANLSDRERINSNNFAGLSRTQNWSGSFSSMRSGVRAHIQHLRGYASTTFRNPNIDPRSEIISGFSGNIRTFDQLYARWQPNRPEIYGGRIDNIIMELRIYSNRL